MLALALAVLLVPAPVTATVAVDDYPSSLKSAAQDSLVDPWNFYNRECTSFVAWRLNNDVGLAFHNWYRGKHWGDAAIWRRAALDSGVPVDGVASRGAIAWWAQGSPGSSSGHVAWVIGVTSSSITVEEYNYVTRGRYDQRTISRTSSKWPTAFIHLGKPTMKNTARPTVTGTPQVGVRLTAAPGTWSPSGATYAYQWYAGGVAVSGATKRTFTPGAAQLGKQIRVKVTASAGRRHLGEHHLRRDAGRRAGRADGNRAPGGLRVAPGGRPGLRDLEHLVPHRVPRLPVARRRQADRRGHPVRLHPDGRAGRRAAHGEGDRHPVRLHHRHVDLRGHRGRPAGRVRGRQPAHGHRHRPGRPAAHRIRGRVVAQRGPCLPVAGGRSTGRRRHRPLLHTRRRRSPQAGRRAGHRHPARLHAHLGHVRRHRSRSSRGRSGTPAIPRSPGRRGSAYPCRPLPGGWSPEPTLRLPVVGRRLPDRGRHLEHVHPHRPPSSTGPCRSR